MRNAGGIGMRAWKWMREYGAAVLAGAFGVCWFLLGHGGSSVVDVYRLRTRILTV